MLRVAVLFLNGGCASTALLPMEIFRNAGVLWNLLEGRAPVPRFRVTTASVGGEPAVTDKLVSLTPACALEKVERPDLVFVPAGGLPLETLVHTGYVIDSVIESNAGVVPWLRRWAAEGTKIAGVCSGVALLAEAGLLDGKRATTHWGLADVYRQRFPAVDWQPDYLITDAGDVFCGGGINSAADLSLYLVERFGSRDLALECAKALLIEMPRTWQVVFADVALRTDHHDEGIRHAQDWLRQHCQKPISMDALAMRVGMSPRNFLRRFKDATGHTPLSYIHALRVAMAKRLLEDGQQTVQEVSQAVGYDDVMFFRGLFKRHTGVCPTEYRTRFGTLPIARPGSRPVSPRAPRMPTVARRSVGPQRDL
ncbi:GlxA family transcriptional regulator [Microvirga lotononidis]|nr:helix-turn-helix domain-containing protein [Microvirga lotononidis]WQO31883.1 helix-turn-helix domain-containing protein [Microvirga lotononidis]